MESSDDSFVWTGASSEGEDSGTMAVGHKNENIHKDKYDSDSGLKKTLQKQLFQGQEHSGFNEDKLQKPKKRKIKEEHPKGEYDGAECVKAEPLSASGRSMLQDDTYLELRVKQEQAALVHTHLSQHVTPIKKRRKDENATQVIIYSDQESESLGSRHSKKKKTKRFCEQDEFMSKIDCDGDYSHNFKHEITDCMEQRAGRKKSKKIRNSDVSDNKDMIIEDLFSAEESVVETRDNTTGQATTTKKSNSIHSKSAIEYNSKEKRKLKSDSSHCYSSKEFVSEESSSDESTNTERNSTKKRYTAHSSVGISMKHQSTDGENKTEETERRSVAILSDRLRFEEENNVDVDKKIPDKTISSQLRRFLKANPYLRSIVANLNTDPLITKDDEVWIIKCPHEIDIISFKDRDLLLDSKCKVKLDGKTYDGTLENEKGTVAILSLEDNMSVIKNLPLTGTLNFRKRIPKAHFIEDNIMANNQTSFIPLPDTKCRHPLFGSDYKRRIKIPASVKARLNATEQEVPIRKKKKKPKRRPSESPNPEPQLPTKPEPEPEPEGKMRCKKRKHMSYGEPTPRKVKQLKLDPEAADAWESEKAIEENLFNY